MAYIKKPPELVSRSIKLEQPTNELLDEYARFVECTPDHVANSVLKKILWRDPEYRKWRAEQKNAAQSKPTGDATTIRRTA
jgi:hypothetical protein